VAEHGIDIKLGVGGFSKEPVWEQWKRMTKTASSKKLYQKPTLEKREQLQQVVEGSAPIVMTTGAVVGGRT